MIKTLKNLISFLTILPVGMSEDCLKDAAEHMYLFPIIGALIGSIGGAMALLLSFFLPNIIVGGLTCGFILLLTGLHHVDGLLDFGDGLMCHGPPDRKIKAMHDVNTGTGGLTLGLITILTTAFCISQLGKNIVFQALVVAETTAKLSMVVLARMGRSAHEGMNTYFVNAMHSAHGNLKLLIALGLSIIIGFSVLGMMGILMIVMGFISATVMLLISNNQFGGITGDVMGATNELTRMFSLIVAIPSL
ncbi:MAG: adenosylcobinamide-GDP ribazoletransferase [Candidatus Bathyarchaeia archaeon]